MSSRPRDGVWYAGAVLGMLLCACVAFWTCVVLVVRLLAGHAGASPWLYAIAGLLGLTLLAAGLLVRYERAAAAAEQAAAERSSAGGTPEDWDEVAWQSLVQRMNRRDAL